MVSFFFTLVTPLRALSSVVFCRWCFGIVLIVVYGWVGISTVKSRSTLVLWHRRLNNLLLRVRLTSKREVSLK